jgi:hypothetical protein
MVGKLCSTSFSAIVLFVLTFASTAFAEEIILEEGRDLAGVPIGDFFCSPCFTKVGSSSFAMGGSEDSQTIEMTTGELWRFFDEQGINSVNQLTLFLEIEQLSSDSRFDLSELNIQIQHPDGKSLLTNMNLGADHLVVPGYETSSSRPEAEIRFDLGYDFMQEFSSESTELVKLNAVSTSALSRRPQFLLTADQTGFRSTHLSTIFGFVFFWGMVFLM